MKNVLLIQKPSALRDFIELSLGSSEAVHLAVSASAAKATHYLEKKGDLDLIFIGHSIEDDLSAQELSQSLRNYVSKNKTILVGTNSGVKKFDNSHYIHAQAPIDKISSLLKLSLDIEDPILKGTDFVPMPLDLCIDFESAPFDIHLKIGEGDSVKYIKRFKAQEQIDHIKIRKYADKNLTKVFILKKDLDQLTVHLKDEVSEENVKKREEKDGFFTAIKESLDYAAYMLEDLGIDEEVAGYVDRSYEVIEDRITKVASSNNDFKKNYFDATIKSEDDFSTKLISLISMLGTNTIKKLSWENEQDLITNFICAAYFQNLTLKGSKKLLSCLDEGDLEELNESEKEIVHEHARESSGILKSALIFSSDVYLMILEQHGSQSGLGFPKVKENSNQLSRLFRIISDFSTELLIKFEKSHDTIDMRSILSTQREQASPSDKEIFDILEQTTFN